MSKDVCNIGLKFGLKLQKYGHNIVEYYQPKKGRKKKKVNITDTGIF